MIKKLLLSLLAIFGFAFLISQNTFAASDDIVYDITSSNYQTTSYYLCSNSSSQSELRCNDYNYLTISSTCSSIYTGNQFIFDYTANGVNASIEYKFNVYPSVSYTFGSLTRFSYNSFALANSEFPSSDCSVRVVLSKSPSSIIPTGTLSITENGTYDVTNYASAVVDVVADDSICDDPWIVRIFKDGFWGVMTALVTLIVPVLALFLIFRLVHDWLWGKG